MLPSVRLLLLLLVMMRLVMKPRVVHGVICGKYLLSARGCDVVVGRAIGNVAWSFIVERGSVGCSLFDCLVRGSGFRSFIGESVRLGDRVFSLREFWPRKV